MTNQEKQSLNLANRRVLELEGVADVINFSEEEILLETNLGSLMIIGEELHIKHLDLETTQLIVEGYINELKYDQETKKGKFLKRLFK